MVHLDKSKVQSPNWYFPDLSEHQTWLFNRSVFWIFRNKHFKCFAAISRSRCLKFFQTFWLISCVVCWLKVLKCFSVLPLVKRRKRSRLQTISFYMRLNGCLKTLNREINYWHLGTERDCLKFLIILLERELSFHKFCLSFGFFLVNYTYLNESTSETLARSESSCLSNLTVVVCTNFLLKSLFP